MAEKNFVYHSLDGFGDWIWNSLDSNVEEHLRKYPDWEGKIKFGPPKDNGKTPIDPVLLARMNGVYLLPTKK